jgi:hypothetical protein
MSAPVDYSREACEVSVELLRLEDTRSSDEIADQILALRAALDAAEREQYAAGWKEGRDAMLADADTLLADAKATADATGYARGVRDAAGVVKEVRDWDGSESYCDSCKNGQANPDKEEVANAILALLLATDATKEKNDAE